MKYVLTVSKWVEGSGWSIFNDTIEKGETNYPFIEWDEVFNVYNMTKHEVIQRVRHLVNMGVDYNYEIKFYDDDGKEIEEHTDNEWEIHYLCKSYDIDCPV